MAAARGHWAAPLQALGLWGGTLGPAPCSSGSGEGLRVLPDPGSRLPPHLSEPGQENPGGKALMGSAAGGARGECVCFVSDLGAHSPQRCPCQFLRSEWCSNWLGPDIVHPHTQEKQDLPKTISPCVYTAGRVYMPK